MKRKLSVWMRISGIVSAVIAITAAECIAWKTADTGVVPTVVAPRPDGSIQIDGRTAESAWRQAPRLVLKDNQTGAKSAQRTFVRVLADKSYLYAAFDCADMQAMATLTTRDDNLWREEVVELFFDPTGEGKRYLEIEVNPLGTLFDAWIRFGPDIDFDKAKQFNLSGVRVATRIQRRSIDPPRDDGWSCEIAIPLDELPDRAGPGARINFARVDRIDGRHVYDAWSPTFKWFHVPDRFGRFRLSGR